ncbi:hypothetical protein pb186bvf_012847 [Paramecium bursaria]
MGSSASNNQQAIEVSQQDEQINPLHTNRRKIYTEQNSKEGHKQNSSISNGEIIKKSSFENVNQNLPIQDQGSQNIQVDQIMLNKQQVQINSLLAPLIEQKIAIQQRERFTQTQEEHYFEFQRRCLINGHKNAQIVEFCMNKQCKESYRFICDLCQKNGLHQQDLNFKQQDIIKQYQIADKIRENFNNQVKIHNYCTDIVDNILKKCKSQVESLHKHMANLTTLVDFNESCQSLRYLKSILKEEVKVGEIANDQLFKIVTEEPETYIFKQFNSIMDNFKLIQHDIEQLNKTSSEIPELQEKIWRILKADQNEVLQSHTDQDKITDEILSEALLLVQQARFKQSLETLNKHLEQNINQKREGEIRITMGYTYYKEKSYDVSRSQYEKALQASNQCDHYIIYYYMGKCQLKSFEQIKDELSQQQLVVLCEDMIKSFRKTIELSPSFRKAYLQISKIYVILEKSDIAVKFLQDGLELDKNNIKILTQLGQINLDLLQYNEALKFYELCLKLNKNYLKALYGKGYILFQLQKYEQAIHYMLEVIKFNSQLPDTYLILCECLKKLNKKDAALQILQEQALRFQDDIRFNIRINSIQHQQIFVIFIIQLTIFMSNKRFLILQ